jgi:MFS family permease
VIAPLAGTHRRRWILAGASTGLVVLMLDSTVVALALPAIRRDLGASLAGVQWVQNAYLLVLAALVLPLGRLGDVLGRKRVLQAGMLGFGAGSAIAATAGSTAQLIAGRALQGAGAAALLALSLAIAAAVVPERERSQALGIWAAVSSVALAVGPPAGGVVIQAASWRWIFWLSIPLMAAAMLVIAATVPESRGESSGRGLHLGASAAAFALAGAYVTAMFLLPQYLEFVLGNSTLRSGLLVLPVTAPVVLIAPFAARLVARAGARPLMTLGMACAAAGMVVVTFVDADTGYRALLPGTLLFGIGLGLAWAPLCAGAMAASPTVAALGGALLLAGGGALFRRVESDHRADGAGFEEAFADALAATAWLLVAVLAAGAFLTWLSVRAAGRASP